MTNATIATKKTELNLATRFVGKLKTYSPEQLATLFVCSTGAILALTGGAYLLESFAKVQSLDLADPVFGLSFRWLVLFFGLLELIVAMFCLFTTRRTLSLWLILWLVAQFAIYRIGLRQMGWSHPYWGCSPTEYVRQNGSGEKCRDLF